MLDRIGVHLPAPGLPDPAHGLLGPALLRRQRRFMATTGERERSCDQQDRRRSRSADDLQKPRLRTATEWPAERQQGFLPEWLQLPSLRKSLPAYRPLPARPPAGQEGGRLASSRRLGQPIRGGRSSDLLSLAIRWRVGQQPPGRKLSQRVEARRLRSRLTALRRPLRRLDLPRDAA